MSTARILVCALAALLMIDAPVFSQASKPGGDTRTRQSNQLQSGGLPTSAAASKNGAQVCWVDITSAPAFPVPLFRGNQTNFIKIDTGTGAALARGANKVGRQMTLSTKDPAGVVYDWYTKYLPASGYKLDDKIPKQQVGGRAYIIKADAEKTQAIITVSSQNGAQGASTLVVITISNKPAARPNA